MFVEDIVLYGPYRDYYKIRTFSKEEGEVFLVLASPDDKIEYIITSVDVISIISDLDMIDFPALLEVTRKYNVSILSKKKDEIKVGTRLKIIGRVGGEYLYDPESRSRVISFLEEFSRKVFGFETVSFIGRELFPPKNPKRKITLIRTGSFARI